MRTLLVINSSSRVTRSVTRRLTSGFADAWRTRTPDSNVVVRDLGLSPPSPINEEWIKAAYDPGSMHAEVLSDSEELIGELIAADAIVMGVPMYNFGLPAQLKAYFDQVIRIGRTFAYDPGEDEPYRPLLEPKPCIVITSVSDVALYPGGEMMHLNHSDPHLSTMLSFIGIGQPTFVRAEESILGDPDALARLEAELESAAVVA